MNYEKLKLILMSEVDDNTLMAMIHDCNGWDGSLEEYRFEENEEDFFNTYFCNTPYKAVQAVSNGEYSFYDPYLKFDYCDNSITSYSENDVSSEICSGKSDIVDRFVDLLEHNHVDKYCISKFVARLESLEDDYDNYVEELTEGNEPLSFDEWYETGLY